MSLPRSTLATTRFNEAEAVEPRKRSNVKGEARRSGRFNEAEAVEPRKPRALARVLHRRHASMRPRLLSLGNDAKLEAAAAYYAASMRPRLLSLGNGETGKWAHSGLLLQ